MAHKMNCTVTARDLLSGDVIRYRRRNRKVRSVERINRAIRIRLTDRVIVVSGTKPIYLVSALKPYVRETI